ncbi:MULTISPECIES: anti-sigma factor domain-containing protein [Bacillota]|uniref:anti-sigma factor domain-containing protein n=1 Tax=Sedimentibacter sp. B4 TaxID=304766 RepID=UPI0012EA876A
MMQKGGLHLIYKGSIVDIKTNYAIVMTDKAEFYKVKKKMGCFLATRLYFLKMIYIKK